MSAAGYVRNADGGAPVGGLSGPEANPLFVADRHLIALDEEMARRAAMTRDRGESLPQLPPLDGDLGGASVFQRLSARRMSGYR